MNSCPGRLVVHNDGTVAYCSEETTGRQCAGEDKPHRGGAFACRVVQGPSCVHCQAVMTTVERERVPTPAATC